MVELFDFKVPPEDSICVNIPNNLKVTSYQQGTEKE